MSELHRIRKLPPGLANRIAAGEVVERPVSVAKELLENSLDAGARQLRVELEAGGVRLLRVRDDGRGIHADDLTLALDRHATSKITRAEDLDRIVTLGFRGEALPGIAAVSRLRLCTRTAAAGQAYEISAADGRISEVRPAAHPPGTTVEVRELFYNVPARRRFLRTDQTEFLQVQDVVRRVALSHAETAVALLHNGREIFRFVGGDLKARVEAVMGAAFLQDARQVHGQAGDYRLHGWLGGPGQVRSQADRQYFFVNGRTVRDRKLNHAVRQASEDLLPEGRYASYVLFLELDPAEVDVNAHPAKQEVRFRRAREVHDFIAGELRRQLCGNRELFARPVPPPPSAAPTPGEVREVLQHYGELTAPTPPPAARAASTPAPPAPVLQALAGGRFQALAFADGLLLIDAGALRERWFIAHLARQDVPRRRLLVPVRARLDDAGLAALESHRQALMALGFRFMVDGHELVFQEWPEWLREEDIPDWSAVFTALASSAAQAGDFSSRLAVALGRITHAEPATRLYRRLAELENLGTDTMGAMRKLTPAELEQLLSISP